MKRTDRAGMLLCRLCRVIGDEMTTEQLAAALRGGIESGYGQLYCGLLVAVTAVMRAAGGAENVPGTWGEMIERYQEAMRRGPL